jgi:peptidyl-prolyl cis-trans isomerase SurA
MMPCLSRSIFRAIPFALMFLSGPLISSARAEPVNRILVTVNQEVITQYDLDQTVARLNRNNEKIKTSTSEDLKKMALDYLIGEALIHNEIQKMGTKVTDKEIDQAVASVLERNKLTLEGLKKQLASSGSNLETYRKGIAEQMARLRWVQQTVGPKVQVSDAEIEAFLAQNSKAIDTAQSVHLAQLVVSADSSSEDDLQKAKERVQKAYQEWKKGKPFEALLKEYGGAGSGDLGKVGFSGLNPSVASAVAPLNAGEVSEPVQSGDGWILVQLIDKPETPLKGNAELKETARDRIYDMKLQEELNRYADQLKGKAYIEVKDGF